MTNPGADILLYGPDTRRAFFEKEQLDPVLAAIVTGCQPQLELPGANSTCSPVGNKREYLISTVFVSQDYFGLGDLQS